MKTKAKGWLLLAGLSSTFIAALVLVGWRILGPVEFIQTVISEIIAVTIAPVVFLMLVAFVFGVVYLMGEEWWRLNCFFT